MTIATAATAMCPPRLTCSPFRRPTAGCDLATNHLSVRLSDSNALFTALPATRLGLPCLKAAAVGALARGVGEKRASAIAALQGDGAPQNLVCKMLQAVAGTGVQRREETHFKEKKKLYEKYRLVSWSRSRSSAHERDA